MANMPEVEVALALGSGYSTPIASMSWTVVDAYVEGAAGLSIERGRQDNEGQVGPSRLRVTLDNKDGRFTPEYAAGAYYPNVKKGCPIRVRVRWVVGSGTWYMRFLGYVDEWPVEWPGGGSSYSTVTISATSRMARLGRANAFRSIIEEEILYDAPKLYFPLGEPQGATTAGNIAPGRSEVLSTAQLGTGGTLEFGAGTGPGTDDKSAPILTPVDTVNGLYLKSNLTDSPHAAGDQHLQLEVWFNAGTSANQQIMTLSRGDTFPLESFGLSVFNGTLTAAWKRDNTLMAFKNASGLTTGATHHAVLKASLSGSNLTLTLIADGVSSSASPAAFGSTTFGEFRKLWVGGDVENGVFNGTVAHAAVYAQASTVLADACFVEHYHAGADGFTADGSGARIQRYARLAGIPSAEISAAPGLAIGIAHKDTTGVDPLVAMEAVRLTEDGVLFDAGSGTLTFQGRDNRYNTTSAFTLDAGTSEVQQGFTPKLDDQQVSNDVTASRPGGIEVRSINQASIDAIGYYRDSIEVLTTSDAEVQSRADWEVNRRGTPRVTVPEVKVHLNECSSSLITSLLAADIGTRFTTSGLPSQAPASSMDFFIEGITEDIGPEDYWISFNTSRPELSNVWRLDSSTYSVLDSTTVLAY